MFKQIPSSLAYTSYHIGRRKLCKTKIAARVVNRSREVCPCIEKRTVKIEKRRSHD
jgi:hypothetical protein